MHAPIATPGATTLRLPREQRHQIERWARDGHPDETCGLLLGRQRGTCVEVVAVRSARNLERARPRERFELDPADHLAAEEAARELALDVVGVWHSHIDHPALPSESDGAQAWSGWSYVIVAVDARGAREMRSWRWTVDRFVEEAILP